MTPQDIIDKIRSLKDEIREIHGAMKENPENVRQYISQLDEIDNEIIQLMDKFIDETNGDTSTK